jgi:excinuclease UvrABC ATPase subunit
MLAAMASPKQHPADSHDLIRVQGARENNLKDVSVEIPKRRLTVFTGVSGSGKSSLVFDTIAAESQRLINETYSAFVQGFMPSLGRPEVDVLEGLTPAIIVDQERMGASSRSKVGTATDANAMLRVLFSRLGKPHIGSSNAFSFNVPSVRGVGSLTVGTGKAEKREFNLTGGMCPRCEGMGSVNDIDLTQLYDDSKSLNEGALTIPGYNANGWNVRITDVTYVFDEPTVGLHPHDIQRMNELLLRLRDKGNTVLVVEHKPETIEIADHVVDLGPGAGAAGGKVVFEGTVEELRASDTLTGRHLSDQVTLKPKVRKPAGVMKVRGARAHNLKNVDVDLPLGVLVVITGVAGSGKSSLIHGSVSTREGVVTVDQAPIRGSRRSNPATYTDLLEPIRKAFAKANHVKPALFSANSEGACPTCNGAGVIYTDLAMMAGVSTVCEDCEGRRFQASVLEYKLGGLDIAQVLDLSVAEAVAFFGAGVGSTPAAHAIVQRMADVGLGYLTLGQPLPTLSGGERQRLKLATHMGAEGGVYVLDEPTTGLHLADLRQLLGLLDRLVDSGKSVIVIEHHQAVMAHADWIIDLGPGAGHEGGEVVFEGTPAELVKGKATLTAKHLAAFVAPRPKAARAR